MYESNFEMPLFNVKRMGEILIGEGLLNIDQLIQGFKIQNETGKRLGEILVELNVINKERLDVVLADREAAVTNDPGPT